MTSLDVAPRATRVVRLRAVAVVAASQVVQHLLTLATGIVIARTLGAAATGELNVLRGLFGMAAILAPLGLDLHLLKFIGSDAARPGYAAATVRRLRRIVLAVNVGLAAALALLAGPIAHVLYPYPEFATLLRITALGLPLAADLAILGACHRAHDRPAAYALCTSVLQPVARVVLVGAALGLGLSTRLVVIINVAQIALSVLALHLDGRWRRGGMTPDAPAAGPPSWAEIRAHFGQSLWMAGSLLAVGLMRTLDVLLLGHYAPAPVVGAYGVLLTLTQVIQIYPLAASQTLGPRVSDRFSARDRVGLQAAFAAYLATAAPIGCFLFAGLAVFADRTDLVFGRSFTFEPAVAVPLAFSALLAGTLAPFGYGLSMTGRHRMETALLVGGALLLLGLGVLLVPRYGATGAAASSAAAFAIVNVLRIALVMRRLAIRPGRWRDVLMLPLALACALSARALDDALAPPTVLPTLAATLAYATAFAALARRLVAEISDPARIATVAARREWR